MHHLRFPFTHEKFILREAIDSTLSVKRIVSRQLSRLFSSINRRCSRNTPWSAEYLGRRCLSTSCLSNTSDQKQGSPSNWSTLTEGRSEVYVKEANRPRSTLPTQKRRIRACVTTNVDRPFCHRASGRVPDRNSSLLHYQIFPLFSCNKMDRSNLRAK